MAEGSASHGILRIWNVSRRVGGSDNLSLTSSVPGRASLPDAPNVRLAAGRIPGGLAAGRVVDVKKTSATQSAADVMNGVNKEGRGSLLISVSAEVTRS